MYLQQNAVKVWKINVGPWFLDLRGAFAIGKRISMDRLWSDHSAHSSELTFYYLK